MYFKSFEMSVERTSLSFSNGPAADGCTYLAPVERSTRSTISPVGGWKDIIEFLKLIQWCILPDFILSRGHVGRSKI